ncbi:MAG TPA: AMP-binding protein [candidate division Zixibacteria bacterium]|nr:AMP-binding protein [candidate division Zixibacteria bacterium]
MTHCLPAPESAAVERATRAEIRRWQEERLVALYRRAWEHVPFYRKRWQEAGLDAGSVRTMGDLARLPVVGKSDFEADLRDHPPFGSYQGDFPAVRVQASSGSSGNPKPFFHTRRDWEAIANLWSRRLYAQGVRPGDVLQVAFTYSLFIAGFTCTEGAMKLGAVVVPAGSGAVTPSERQVRLLSEWGAAVVAGTPSYVLHLADVAERAGMDLRRDFKLRIAVHTAEPMSEAARRSIEARWGVRAYDNFGSVETGAPTFECEERDGYHVNEDAYLFEVLDRDTLAPVGAGEEGVVVVTSLFKEAAPVIRYNLEDVSSMIDAPCRCGRSFRRLAKIKGRTSEMLKVRGVPFYPSAVEAVLEGFPELTREYRLVLDRAGGQDRVLVQAERRSNAGGDDSLRERLERALKVAIGLSIDAELLAPGALGRALEVEGRVKVKRVWDRRGSEDV